MPQQTAYSLRMFLGSEVKFRRHRSNTSIEIINGKLTALDMQYDTANVTTYNAGSPLIYTVRCTEIIVEIPEPPQTI